MASHPATLCAYPLRFSGCAQRGSMTWTAWISSANQMMRDTEAYRIFLPRKLKHPPLGRVVLDYRMDQPKVGRKKKDDKAKEKHERNGNYSQKHVRLMEALQKKSTPQRNSN